MNVEYCRHHVNKIEMCSGDPEVAHAMEDKLRVEFLEFITSNKCTSLKEVKNMAVEILKSGQIEFERWCA